MDRGQRRPDLVRDQGEEVVLELLGLPQASHVLEHDGVLRNVPREEHGIELVAGRPVANALVFT